MIKILQGITAALLVGLSAPANAVYCDYCRTGSWECRPSYVSVGDDAPVFAGSVCTYFYNSGSGDEYPDTIWSDYYDRAYAGGAYRFIAERIIDNATDAVYADCDSDTTTRWQHANRDTAISQVASLATGQGLLRTNQIVRVTYDDGSSEAWKVTAPTSSSPLFDVPVPNSLICFR